MKAVLAGGRPGLVLAVVLGFLASSCSEAPAPAIASRPSVRLSTGPATGTLQTTGLSLQREFNKLPAGPTIQTVLTTGAVDNVVTIQDGEADLGLTYSDVAYNAYAGRLERRSDKFDRLAGVALMQVAPLHIVVSSTSHIKSVADLRGKRIGMAGAAGSASRITAQSVLNVLGAPVSTVKIEPLNTGTAFARLEKGEVDAMLQVGLDPIDWIQRALKDGSRLLPLGASEVDRLSQVYPFFRPTVIRQSLYGGLKGSVPTIGVDGLLVCRKDLDEQLVYDVTKALFQVLPALSFPDGAAFLDVEQAAATPIPLHAGASRFYRERQLSR